MSPMQRDHNEWLITAKKKNAKCIVNVCDTWDYENYPVYVMPDDNLNEIIRSYHGKNMQRVEAIVDVETGKIIK